MTLSPGARLGPYEVIAAIGAGGMGEVYRAKDANLGRDVAIKVLPAAMAGDPERLARFRREAQVLGSLNHPNIAHVYGFESAALEDGLKAHFLAMELVEGEDLSERLKRGAIPVDEAIAIAKQIAFGLEEAHERGIIHRDLKPANIKLTPDGKVKVLDFGLAKALEGDPSSSAANSQLSHSPTISRHMTEAGMIMGTAAYMSPEQARGKPVDKRADIWSFGVVLYEMLTGTRAFSGETVSDSLAAVLRADLDWKTLPPDTPAEIRQLIRRCLERDLKNRLHDIADARITIEEARGGEIETRVTAPQKISRAWTSMLPWAMAVVAIAAALTLGLRNDRPRAEPRPLTTFGVIAPAETFLTHSQSPILGLSKDGRTLLFVAEGDKGASIYRRSFDRMDIFRIEGTEDAEQPLLSPDGKWIAFFSLGRLRKISTSGGPPVALAEALAPRGASFSPDGSLVFSPLYNSGLLRVSATGGPPTVVTKLGDPKVERSHRWPQVLPGGKAVIFTVGLTDSPGNYDTSNIDGQSLDTGERRTILKGARMAQYTSLGYLVYQRGQTLLAVKFDVDALETRGEPFTIQEGVGGDTSSGSGYFSVSDNGVVAVVPDASILQTRVLVLVDQAGRETKLDSAAASIFHPRISPDGKRIVFAIGGGSSGDDDIYTYEMASRRTQRLTFDQGHGHPLWSPDGRGIIFTNGRSGDTAGLAMKASDGSGKDRVILKSIDFRIGDSWHADGRRLAITNAGHSIDVEMLDTKDGSVSPLFANPAAGESQADFSPDGRYIAYGSTVTGTDEVVVETFPPGGGKWQISVAGGLSPVWARNGRTLYFIAGQSMMAVDVDTHEGFHPGTPRVLFTGPYEFHTVANRNFDVGPDRRFALVKRQLDASVRGEIVVLDGWSSMDSSREPGR